METFILILKPATLRLILSIAITKVWDVQQLDISNAFLHGFLDENIYILLSPRFDDPTKLNHVFLLKRSLYGFE